MFQGRYCTTGWSIFLGSWVGFDFGCSTLCVILLGLMVNWQNWPTSWVKWWNIIGQSQPIPTQLSEQMDHP